MTAAVMSENELSRSLAEALGYPPECIDGHGWIVSVYRLGTPNNTYRETPAWFVFDYRDPSVALPVLELLVHKHLAWLSSAASGEPFCIFLKIGESRLRFASESIYKTIALAAIAVNAVKGKS